MSKIEVNTVEPQCGTTLTLGGSGDTVTLGSGASQSGFGRTGTVDWQTGSIKTATFTAVSGEGYFCNTAGGAFEVDLPAGSAGAIVSVQDYNNTFDSNALTIDPNGSEKINGGAGALVLSTEGQGITLVYIDSTVGWRSIHSDDFATIGSDFIVATGGTITTCGNDKIHTFTGPGTFTVTATAACAANSVVSHLVVAGGGGSGGDLAGGGGAGGYREVKSPVTPYTASPLDGYPSAPNRVSVTAQAYPITVGAGGAAGSSPTISEGCRGSNSVFSTITSTGGGAGMVRTEHQKGSPSPGKAPGGSGGGASYNNGTNGTGNTPPVTPPQGNNGGTAPGSTDAGAGGGGGATAAGGAATGPSSTQGAGGAGATSSINGTPTTRAGGGGGGGWSTPGQGGAAGSGGGGVGGSPPNGPNPINGTAGTANTGGGAGGAHAAGCAVGATGGSGIVIIRYKFQ